MLIQKDYKFYAAHRNEELTDKCHNLHGHRYGICCHFAVERTGSYSTLFADFDRAIEPLLKSQYDHGMLIHRRDPLYETLLDHMRRTGECLKLKVLDFPTTVENLAYQLFTEITALGFRLELLEVRETDTSVVHYSHADWLADQRHLAGLTGTTAAVCVNRSTAAHQVAREVMAREDAAREDAAREDTAREDTAREDTAREEVGTCETC